MTGPPFVQGQVRGIQMRTSTRLIPLLLLLLPLTAMDTSLMDCTPDVSITFSMTDTLVSTRSMRRWAEEQWPSQMECGQCGLATSHRSGLADVRGQRFLFAPCCNSI